MSSNKIQISCNFQNRLTSRTIKLYWQRIELDYKELIKSETERNYLKGTIIKLRQQKQNECIEIKQLKGVLRRIKFIRKQINMINEWRLEKVNKLVIC